MYVNQLGVKVSEQNNNGFKIVYVTEEQISCMGEDGDHPKVYYTLKNGEAICGYCNIKYILKKDD